MEAHQYGSQRGNKGKQEGKITLTYNTRTMYSTTYSRDDYSFLHLYCSVSEHKNTAHERENKVPLDYVRVVRYSGMGFVLYHMLH